MVSDADTACVCPRPRELALPACSGSPKAILHLQPGGFLQNLRKPFCPGGRPEVPGNEQPPETALKQWF